MIDQKLFLEILEKNGVDFFTGVPDSYLNGFCNHLMSYCPERNIIAANEGNAIGIAAGHYFATEKIPLVYMQNSGMGNSINPLVSLADKKVYSVPMLLLIGWRGQPGTGDWPQHELQGEITEKLLDVMHIPHVVLTEDPEELKKNISDAVSYCRENRSPFGLIVPKGAMSGNKDNPIDTSYPLSRENAIEIIIDNMPEDTIFCATTGRATRELFFLRRRRGESGENDYLNVGSMGHTSSVALGIAQARPDRRVVVLDGDSAAIMHMGAMTMVSKLKVPNYMHIILNNGAHESVGGQPSAGMLIDFTEIAKACGYATMGKPVVDKPGLEEALRELKGSQEATFIDVRIHKGLSGKLPPLDFSHRDAIDELIDNLNRR